MELNGLDVCLLWLFGRVSLCSALLFWCVAIWWGLECLHHLGHQPDLPSGDLDRWKKSQAPRWAACGSMCLWVKNETPRNCSFMFYGFLHFSFYPWDFWGILFTDPQPCVWVGVWFLRGVLMWEWVQFHPHLDPKSEKHQLNRCSPLERWKTDKVTLLIDGLIWEKESTRFEGFRNSWGHGLLSFLPEGVVLEGGDGSLPHNRNKTASKPLESQAKNCSNRSEKQGKPTTVAKKYLKNSQKWG